MDGRTRRWQEHNQEQRRRLVEAAISLYDEGLATASLLEIGQRAGVSRASVYRQFSDRADLERAVQEHLLGHLWSIIAPTLQLGRTVRETIHGSASAYVGWAAAHPQLHRVMDLDATPDGARERGLRQVAAAVADALVWWFGSTGAEVSADDRAAAQPLAFGLVSGVHGTVRRWLDLGAEVPDERHLVELVTDAAWAMIDVRLRAYGIAVDPRASLEPRQP